MTPQQQIDLKTWLKDTSQELPESLKNVFIDRCLEELEFKIEPRLEFNKISHLNFGQDYQTKNFGFGFPRKPFKDLNRQDQVLIVIFLLSRAPSHTPNGEAVMPFLDVETKAVKEFWIGGEINGVPQECFEYFTLDHLLHREFTEALRLGKPATRGYIDEKTGQYVKSDLEIINLIYLMNVYGTK